MILSRKSPNIHFTKIMAFPHMQIFCDLANVISSLTENEAHRFGRFLHSCLSIVERWRFSKDIYDKVCGYQITFIFILSKSLLNEIAKPYMYV